MKFEWIRNLDGGKPNIMLLPFKAGADATPQRGDPLVLDTGYFVPLESDASMSATVAISDCSVKAGDVAGYRPAIVPRPGDIFRAQLATPSAAARGAAVYVTDATGALALAGSNQFGDVFDHSGFPLEQGKADVGDVADRGTTVNATKWVEITIKASVSYHAALQS